MIDLKKLCYKMSNGSDFDYTIDIESENINYICFDPSIGCALYSVVETKTEVLIPMHRITRMEKK